MWDFLQYTFRKQAFSLSRDVLEAVEAGTRARVGVGVGVQVSKIVLKIRCKLSSEYLRISIAVAGMTKTKSFTPKSLAGYSENSDLGGREESRGASKGAIEKRSWQKQLQSQTEVILVQTFF